jgi:hypothetical protein
MKKSVISSHNPDAQIDETLKKRHQEFLDLFLQHKYMVENEIPILTSLYLKKIGRLQLELLKKKTELAALKMTLKLIQAAINRDEKPDMVAIEKIIHHRLENYYQQIKAQTEALEEAKKVLSHLLSAEESQKLKEVFRLLCKKLHPDLHPFQSEEEKDLFIKVKAAYDLKLLSELQKILLYMEDLSDKNAHLKTLDDKNQHLVHLEQQISDIKEKIQKLLSSFPFNMKENISDDKWVKTEQKELHIHIQNTDEAIKKHQNIIQLITED